MITKILVAFDGSKSSLKALEFALDLAEKYSAQLSILDVMEPPVYGSQEDSMAASAGMAGLVKDLTIAHQKTLTEAKRNAQAQKPNLEITTELREGNPSAQIVNAVQEGNFDIVVLGHGGESRLREMFLGGTSERVAHTARCTVIIVK